VDSEVITKPLTGFDTKQAVAVVWQALELLDTKVNDKDWDEICTAMAWIKEALEDNGSI
jgi:hypothetical protein